MSGSTFSASSRAEQDAFIRRDLVEESVRRYAQFPEGDEVQLGIDVARYGSDDSCIAVRKGNKVIHLESRHGLSNPEVAAWAIELARQYRADTIKVDDTGLGGGATDILNASEAVYELDVSIVPLNFGGAGNEFYANAATVWYATLKDLFFSGDIAIPDNEQLIDELSTRRYTATAQGKTKLESKEDYKKRSKKSPDHADALALCFAPAPTSAWDGSIYDWS
jgi:hypothetical protein